MEYTGQATSRFTFADIVYEKKDGIARVTLNRPDVYNAYSSDTLREMTEAFRDAMLDDSVGVVVLTGAGDKAFCAGSDAREFSKEFLRRPRNFWKFQGLLA
jgi:1,4-dihydroxy-2-naphthoyl-CoA synthase